jgi:hypothetical protein
MRQLRQLIRMRQFFSLKAAHPETHGTRYPAQRDRFEGFIRSGRAEDVRQASTMVHPKAHGTNSVATGAILKASRYFFALLCHAISPSRAVGHSDIVNK